MPYRTCDHLKEDGVYCSSPALRDQRYCYFHLNARARRVQAARARLHADPRRFQMPILDNMHAVQAGIQQVVDALADDRIDNRRAGLLLYALQQAASGLRSTPEWKGQRPEIAPDEPLRALEINSLQNQYGLPYDTDFDAPPDVAAAEIDATVALPLDARLGQTEQPVLARVPAQSAPVAEAPLDATLAAAPAAVPVQAERHALSAVDRRRDSQPAPDAPATVRKPPAATLPAATDTPASAA